MVGSAARQKVSRIVLLILETSAHVGCRGVDQDDVGQIDALPYARASIDSHRPKQLSILVQQGIHRFRLQSLLASSSSASTRAKTQRKRDTHRLILLLSHLLNKCDYQFAETDRHAVVLFNVIRHVARNNNDIATAPSTPLHPQSSESYEGRLSCGRTLRRASPAPMALDLYPLSQVAVEGNSAHQGQKGFEGSCARPELDAKVTVVLDEDEDPRNARMTLSFNNQYLTACKLVSFNPNHLGDHNLDVLLTLGRLFGPGITKGQFRQVLRKCSLCRNVCYVERREYHRCGGKALDTQEDDFDFVTALMSWEENAGLNRFDLCRLFARCGDFTDWDEHSLCFG
ncbi:hypothetical protein NMY22_g19744 [Coprinellus aureogranulatus]|nr:hypothetical protein NMY22_g19744 [Coprinellus aureogranulatus]